MNELIAVAKEIYRQLPDESKRETIGDVLKIFGKLISRHPDVFTESVLAEVNESLFKPS